MHKILTILLVVGMLVIPAAANASIRVDPRIIGGTPGIQGQLGFMALVIYDRGDGTGWACSGTVVASNVILTAGHCAIDENTGEAANPSGYTVVTGSVDWTNASLRNLSAVSQVVVDPAYNPATRDADAALLVLSRPISAPSVALLTGEAFPAGTAAAIAGWGLTSSNGAIPDVLQWASTVLQSPTYCSDIYSGYDSTLQLCAVDTPSNETATCNGDSGGPLLTSYNNQLVEIGITSYGPTDCDAVSADYFTAIQPQSSWIDSEIAAVQPTPAPPPPTPTPAPTPDPHPAPVVKCVVPRLTGKPVNQAKKALNEAHCSIGNVYEPKHVAERRRLKVVSQSPTNGSYVKGHRVALTLK